MRKKNYGHDPLVGREWMGSANAAWGCGGVEGGGGGYILFPGISLRKFLEQQKEFIRLGPNMGDEYVNSSNVISSGTDFRIFLDKKVYTMVIDALATTPKEALNYYTCAASVSRNRNTVRCRYYTVNFLTHIWKRHRIARQLGRGMGCLLWTQHLIGILPQSL